MDQENQESSLITWVVIIGILLTIIVAVSAYVIANPESTAQLFGHKTLNIKPVVSTNGETTTPEHLQPPHTKHYANIYFEFDYPDNFTVTDELINKKRTENGDEEEFGSTEITLTATSTEGTYVMKISSLSNAEHTSNAQLTKNAKEEFFSRTNNGANDSFQDITVIDRPGYKYFTAGHIHLGIPTEILLYSADITWDPSIGASTANSYLGVIEDSFVLK